LIELAPRRIVDLNQPQLELANLFGAQTGTDARRWSRQFAEVTRESLDVIGIGIDGANGQISHQHVFGHAFGNRRLPLAIGTWHRVEPHGEVLKRGGVHLPHA
jgi:hypothetical protein